MGADLFDFWDPKRIGIGDHIHPADRAVLDDLRMRSDPRLRDLNLAALPGCFHGPLKTAPVVLLYGSPGIVDGANTNDPSYQAFMANVRTGNAPSPTEADNESWGGWCRKSTMVFEDAAQGIDFELLRHKVAVLNYGAYHRVGKAPAAGLINALPSSQVVSSWANNVLFPQARAKKKVVVRIVDQGLWKLPERADGYLFAPGVTQSRMHRCALRDEIVARVQEHVL